MHTDTLRTATEPTVEEISAAMMQGPFLGLCLRHCTINLTPQHAGRLTASSPFPKIFSPQESLASYMGRGKWTIDSRNPGFALSQRSIRHVQPATKKHGKDLCLKSLVLGTEARRSWTDLSVTSKVLGKSEKTVAATLLCTSSFHHTPSSSLPQYSNANIVIDWIS